MEAAFRYLSLTYQEPHRNVIYNYEYIELTHILLFIHYYSLTRIWSKPCNLRFEIQKECHELFHVLSSKVLADHFLQEQMYLQYRRISVWYKISVGRIPGHRGRSPKGPGAVVPCRILQLGLDPQALLIIIYHNTYTEYIIYVGIIFSFGDTRFLALSKGILAKSLNGCNQWIL